MSPLPSCFASNLSRSFCTARTTHHAQEPPTAIADRRCRSTAPHASPSPQRSKIQNHHQNRIISTPIAITKPSTASLYNHGAQNSSKCFGRYKEAHCFRSRCVHVMAAACLCVEWAAAAPVAVGGVDAIELYVFVVKSLTLTPRSYPPHQQTNSRHPNIYCQTQIKHHRSRIESSSAPKQ